MFDVGLMTFLSLFEQSDTSQFDALDSPFDKFLI